MVLGFLACLALGGWPGVSNGQAQTSTWIGAAGNSWGTPGNWDRAPAFDGTDRLLLSNLVEPYQVLGSNRSINLLTLARSGFSVTGNSLALYGAGAGIVSTGNNTVGSGLYPQVPVTYQSNSGTLTLSGDVIVNGVAFPTLTGAGNFTITGIVQGGGGLVMNGSGTLLLTAANFYNGAMTINAGTLKYASTASNTANGPLILGSGGTLDLNGRDLAVPSLRGAGAILLGNNTLTITAGGSAFYPLSFTGPITGAGGVVVQLTAGNAQSLGGDSTYAGGTTVKSGFLTYNADANLGAPAGKLTLDGGGIKFGTGGGTVTRPVVIGSGGATFTTERDTTSYLPSAISGNGPVTYGYNSSSEGIWIASGSYTYTGKTTIATGSLAVTDDSQLGAVNNAVTAVGSLILRGGVTVPSRAITLNGYGGGYFPGTLISETGTNVWAGPVTVGNLGYISVAAGSTFTLSGPISGSTLYLNSVGDTLITGTVSTTISKGEDGTLTLSGGNAAYGLIAVGGATVLAGSNAVSATGGGITLDRGGTVRLGANQTVKTVSDYGRSGTTLDLGSHDLTLTSGGSFAGTITGAGRVFMQGTGTLILSGANTFSGGLYIDSGSLVVTSDGSLGAAGNPVVFRGGTFEVNGDVIPFISHPLTFTTADTALNISGGTLTFAQPLTNTGSFTKLGTGTLVLTGNNTYAGGTILSEGTLSVSSDATLGMASGGLALRGGTLQVTGNTFHSTARAVTTTTAYSGIDVADAANTFTLGTVSGAAGGIRKYGVGTLVLAGQTTFSAAYANGGTLRFGAGNLLAANSTIAVSAGATFDLAGFNQTVSSVGASGTLATGEGTLSVTTDVLGSGAGGLITGQLALTGSNVRFFVYNAADVLRVTAAVTGNGALTKMDNGSVILGGDNPFTGTAVVNAGTLTVTGSLLNASGATVARGAVLEVADGRLGVNGNVTNNGFLRLTGSATLAVTGAINNNGVLDISRWNGTLPANIVTGTGGVVLDAAALRVVGITRSASSVQVTVNGLVGLSYQLQRATSLSLGDWQYAGASSVPQAATVNGPFSLTERYPLTGRQGFYRVIVSQSNGSGH